MYFAFLVAVDRVKKISSLVNSISFQVDTCTHFSVFNSLIISLKLSVEELNIISHWKATIYQRTATSSQPNINITYQFAWTTNTDKWPVSAISKYTAEREFQINDNTLHVREYFFYIQLLDVAVVGTLKSEWVR